MEAACADPFNFHEGQKYYVDLKKVSTSILGKYTQPYLSDHIYLCKRCRAHFRHNEETTLDIPSSSIHHADLLHPKKACKDINNLHANFATVNRPPGTMPSYHPVVIPLKQDEAMRYNYYYTQEDANQVKAVEALRHQPPKVEKTLPRGHETNVPDMNFDLSEEQYLLFYDKMKVTINELDGRDNVALNTANTAEIHHDANTVSQHNYVNHREFEHEIFRDQTVAHPQQVIDTSRDYVGIPMANPKQHFIAAAPNDATTMMNLGRPPAQEVTYPDQKMTVNVSKDSDLKNLDTRPKSDGPLKWRRVMDTTVYDEEINSISPSIIDGVKSYKCPRCIFTTKRRELMKYHYYRHVGIKPFGCDYCKYCSSDPAGLRRHFTIHTKLKPHECTICNYRSNIKSNLRQHMLTHDKTRVKKFQCNICQQKFFRERHYNTHMEMQHSEEEKSFRCDKCDFVTEKIWHLYNHKVIHSNKVFQCEECNYSTKRKHEMKHHMDFHKGLFGIKCQVCDKSFPNKKEFAVHFKMHGEHPFQCDQCEYKCRYHYEMTRHKKTHDFYCDQCPYGTSDRKELLKHVKEIHNPRYRKQGEKRYFCTICDKGFTRKTGLKQHHARCHPKEREEKPESELYSVCEALPLPPIKKGSDEEEELEDEEIETKSHIPIVPEEKSPAKVKKGKKKLKKVKRKSSTDAANSGEVTNIKSKLRRVKGNKIVLSKDIFICHLCEREFQAEKELARHIKGLHGIQEYCKRKLVLGMELNSDEEEYCQEIKDEPLDYIRDDMVGDEDQLYNKDMEQDQPEQYQSQEESYYY